jgi:hypothetical protein
MNEKRDAYVQKLKAQLDEWNADINKLEAKSHEAEAGAKIVYHKRIADLRARLKEVGDKIGELQQTGEEPWEDLKQGLEMAKAHALVVHKSLISWIISKNTWLQFVLVITAIFAVFANVFPLEMQRRIINDAINLRKFDLLVCEPWPICARRYTLIF